MDFKHILNRLKSAKFWMHFFGYFAFIMVFIILSLWVLDLYTHHGEGVSVPDVTGMNYEAARDRLDNEDLNALIVDSQYVKGLGAGTVLDQMPKAGAVVKSSRTIYLTVNAASAPTRALPDLADNSSVRQAQVKLRAMGFKMGPVEPIDGEKDWVYAIKINGQKVFAGDRVPSDAILTLVVGTGLYSGENDSIQYSIHDVGDYSENLSDDGFNENED